MVNIKSYKDGDRLIIAIENCTGELAVKVNNFLADIIGLEIEPQPVQGLKPLDIPNENPSIDIDNLPIAKVGSFSEKTEDIVEQDYIFKEGKYSGLTVEKAIKKYGYKAAIQISVSTELKQVDKSTKEHIINFCKKNLYKHLMTLDPELDSFSTIKLFFKEFQPLIGSGVKDILCMSGYASLKEFFDFSEEKIQRDAYESLINSLIERLH